MQNEYTKFQSAAEGASEDIPATTYGYERRPGPSPMKQRPLHTIMKRKQLATALQQSVKPEQKVISSEAKLTKESIKTSASTESSTSRKPEPKKTEKEKAPMPASAELSHGGHYELNEKMTRIVEAELQDIMIKVWQELPDNPLGEAECLVVDKLRNKAGDDLRNVLGLNITKRLLNVHNPLYVKVQFSGKPEKVHLGEFLKKYNFNAFKRIEKTVNMFAAQIRTIADFDKICSDKDIRCGNIKVTVNPIYTFTKCPPNLVTSFSVKTDDSNKDKLAIKDVSTEKLDVSNIISPDKNKTDIAPQKPKAEVNKVENIDKSKQVANKTAENKTAANKPAVENKTTNSKPTTATPTVNKPAAEIKTVLNKPAVENKTAINKPAVENKTTPNKPIAENKTTASKPAAEKKTVKPAIENKTVAKKPTFENKPPPINNTPLKKTVENADPSKLAENKPVAIKTSVTANKPADNKGIKKPAPVNAKLNTTPVKTQTPAKPAVNLPAKQVFLPSKKTKKIESDFDELDDHDILALMSEGIVLDECSGSDDE